MPNNNRLLEVCLEDASLAECVKQGGAQRIELCRDLQSDGLSPSVAECKLALKAGISVHAMIRPYPGKFIADAPTIKKMLEQITEFDQIGVDGYVFGLLTQDQQLDIEKLQQLLNAAGGRACCFHRAFDLIDDKFAALDQLVEIGFSHVLTAGGDGTARENVEILSKLVVHAGDRIKVIVGGGVRSNHAMQLSKACGAEEYHSALDRQPTTQSVCELVVALQ